MKVNYQYPQKKNANIVLLSSLFMKWPRLRTSLPAKRKKQTNVKNSSTFSNKNINNICENI